MLHLYFCSFHIVEMLILMASHRNYWATKTATSKLVNISATMATLDTLPSHAGETEASFMASGSPGYLCVL